MSNGYSHQRYNMLPAAQQLGPQLCTKTYVEVRIAQVLDRNIPEHDEMWSEMVHHHCFNGNDSMMILDRFYGNEEVDTLEEQTGLYRFVKEYLKQNGIDDTQYDDILLDITW